MNVWLRWWCAEMLDGVAVEVTVVLARGRVMVAIGVAWLCC